jgi:uncharacterized protein YycO
MSAHLANPGDILLVRTNHFVSKLIRFGQRGYGKSAAQWNHVAIYIGNGEIVEALTTGITRGFASKYPSSDVRVISPIPKIYGAHVPFHDTERMSIIDNALRANAANFAESCVGEKYGFLTILAIAIKTLTKGKIDFNLQGTNICSGLAARSLERMGYNFNPYDPAELTPAYLDTVLLA